MLPKITRAAAVCLLFSAAGLATAAQSLSSTPREEKLLNGLKLLMFNDPTADKVWLRVRINSGSAFDPQGKEGVMKLLASNIFPNPDIKGYFTDELGGNLDIDENYDFIQITASSKPEGALQMLETVANAITSLPIDKETTAKLRSAQLKRLEEVTKDPAYVADQAAAARLLGTYPYGRPVDGTAASIQKIDFADLLDAKQRFFTADNAAIVISGKIDPDLMYRAVRRYMGPWLKAEKLVPATFRQPDDPPTALLTVESPDPNRYAIRFITRGTSRGSADAAAYSIAARIVEARLNQLVPEKTSEIVVKNDEHLLPGTFTIAFTGDQTSQAAKIDANDLISKALSAPVTDAEFQTAKRAFLSDLDKGPVGDLWLDAETYKTDRPVRYRTKVDSTSLTNVQDVFARLQRQPFATVVVSSAKASS